MTKMHGKVYLKKNGFSYQKNKKREELIKTPKKSNFVFFLIMEQTMLREVTQ